MRQLVTIGDLQRGRGRRRYDALRGIAATKTDFVPLTQAMFDAASSAGTISPALVLATVAMLQHFKTDGVPNEHDDDPYVLKLQQAYNADALSSNGKLDEDGGYGPNTYGVTMVLASHTPTLQPVPAVVGLTKPAATTPTSPTIVSKPTSGKSVWPWVAVGAGALVLYLIMSKRRKRRSGGHASPVVAVVR